MDRRTLLFASASATLLVTPAADVVAQPAGGRFDGTLMLEVGSDPRLMRLARPYAYIDRADKRWPVPEGTLVDGASIPRPLWPIVGSPFTGAYRNASVIHDFYCDVRTRPWQEVHRMFYEAMLSNNVNELQAKTMYMAVYYGGPRWSEVVVRNMQILQAKNAETKGGPEGVADLGKLQRVPTGLGVDIAVPQQDATAQTAKADYTFIAVENPVVDRAAFSEMKRLLDQGNLSLAAIDDLVEAKRLQR